MARHAAAAIESLPEGIDQPLDFRAQVAQEAVGIGSADRHLDVAGDLFEEGTAVDTVVQD